MFYEIIFESGEVSVANYESDEEALAALTEQNTRAKSGGKNGPQGGPATRIARVLKYDVHPGSLNEDGNLSADEVKSAMGDVLKAMTDSNGVVNVAALANAISGISHPMVNAEGAHDSRFKMAEKGELSLEALGNG